jgi:murein DD-endopeptidase MepM/ murein hydrolase activator NlpD
MVLVPRVALVLVGTTAIATAEPAMTVAPASVHPGDAAVVTVTGVTDMPKGKAGGHPLAFFAGQDGYRAIFATALDVDEDHILVEVSDGPRPVSIAVAPKTFPETSVLVEDELANPDEQDRERIDADNRAITESYAKADDAPPQLARPFRRPPGVITSPFGEWRTFNDGHRSRHLGVDFRAREGSKVRAIGDGTVVLVRALLLAGNVVVVAHGGRICSLYFHLAGASVAEGDRVEQGAVIGRAGHTGRTTGPHLHLSIHVNGGMVDPVSFFALPLAPARSPNAR